MDTIDCGTGANGATIGPTSMSDGLLSSFATLLVAPDTNRNEHACVMSPLWEHQATQLLLFWEAAGFCTFL